MFVGILPSVANYYQPGMILESLEGFSDDAWD